VSQEELDAISASEEELDRADEFESKLNFRFEENGDAPAFQMGEQGPKAYPRDLVSVRAVKPKARKLARERTKERKLKDRERLANELKELKAQKRKEIINLTRRGRAPDELEGKEEEEELARQMEGMDEAEAEKFLDEYLKLDYEGIAGGEKMRFPYMPVKPESYGLNEEDILKMDDSVLERYVPMRALAAYNEREFKPTSQKRNFLKKQKIRLEAEEEQRNELEEEEHLKEQEKKRRREEKKRKKEKKKRSKLNELEQKKNRKHKKDKN
jgi:hypothetical protein